VIDAMDLLHNAPFDGFCPISSEIDFTRLPARVREKGVDVFTCNEQKTGRKARLACQRFIYTENVLPRAKP
jgi:hypothetical protein